MEKMAIMKHVEFGVDDRGNISLRFHAYEESGVAALQVIPCETAILIIKKYGVSDIHHLEGLPCIVERDGNTLIYKRECFI